MNMFADLMQSLRAVKSERVAMEARLEAAKLELAALNAPMCKADVLTQLDAYIDGCREIFDENLWHVLRLHNTPGNESFNNIGGGLPLLRRFSGTIDDRLQVAVLAPQLKAAIRESLKEWKCPGTPLLTKRRARRAELEAEIESLKTKLNEIMDAADAARNQLS